jgi:hypothetical protein
MPTRPSRGEGGDLAVLDQERNWRIRSGRLSLAVFGVGPEVVGFAAERVDDESGWGVRVGRVAQSHAPGLNRAGEDAAIS